MYPHVERAYYIRIGLVRLLLEERNLTVTGLAKALELDPRTVRRWLNGRTAAFESNIAKLAQALGTTIGALVESAEPMNDLHANAPTNTTPPPVVRRITIVVEGNIQTLDATSQEALKEGIGRICDAKVSEIRILNMKPTNSVAITLEVTPELADKLEQAFDTGQLLDLKIINIYPAENDVALSLAPLYGIQLDEETVEKYRLGKGLSQKQFVRLVGAEAGQPSAFLARIANCLNVPNPALLVRATPELLQPNELANKKERFHVGICIDTPLETFAEFERENLAIKLLVLLHTSGVIKDGATAIQLEDGSPITVSGNLSKEDAFVLGEMLSLERLDYLNIISIQAESTKAGSGGFYAERNRPKSKDMSKQMSPDSNDADHNDQPKTA